MSFSLYVHIPYCDSKCPYCDFNSYAAKRWPEADYVAALIHELHYRRDEPHWRGQQIRTVFFGGGTPSLFAPQSIGALLEAAASLFGMEADCEVTLEANPGTVDRSRFCGLASAGVNRVSLGAQSFDPRMLAFLGRIHTAEQTRRAVDAARRAGIGNLSLDLIFAIPGQGTTGVLSDIAAAVELAPEHISAYNLTFEEGTAFGSALRSGRIKPLAEEEQAVMYAAVRGELPRRGYRMYEISNYAPPGREARHNLTYWRAESYLGIGAGAHSYGQEGARGRRWWNERSPAIYVERALRDGIAEAGGEALDETVSAAEFAFLNLRLRQGMSLARFRERFGWDALEYFASRIRRLIEGGLLLTDGDRLRLSERGLEVADSIFAEFL